MWTVREIDLKKRLAEREGQITLTFRPVEHQGKLENPKGATVAYQLEIGEVGIANAILLNTRGEVRIWRNLSSAMAFVETLSPDILDVRVLTRKGASNESS